MACGRPAATALRPGVPRRYASEDGRGHPHLLWMVHQVKAHRSSTLELVHVNWFMKFIMAKGFMPFVHYRVALGILIIMLVSTGALSPHAAEPAG